MLQPHTGLGRVRKERVAHFISHRNSFWGYVTLASPHTLTVRRKAVAGLTHTSALLLYVSRGLISGGTGTMSPEAQ